MAIKKELILESDFEVYSTGNNSYIISASKTTIVKSKEDSYTWTAIGTEKELGVHPFDCLGVFQNQQGLRSVLKYLVKFNKESRKDLFKALNTSGFLTFNETSEGFLLGNNTSINLLKELPGVTSVEEIAVIERKEYKPTLVSTGIFTKDNIPWHILRQVGEFKSFLLGSNQIVKMNNEILIPVHSLVDYTIIREGEALAEINFINKVSIIQKDKIAII